VPAECGAGKERSAYTGRCVKSCPAGTARNAKNRCTKRQAAGRPMAVRAPRARRPSVAALAAEEASGQPAEEIQIVADAAGESPDNSARALASVHAHPRELELAAAAEGITPVELALTIAADLVSEGKENDSEAALELLQLMISQYQARERQRAIEAEIESLLEAQPAPAGAGLRRRRARRY